MFISRRRYEMDLQEATEKGRYEAEKEVWQQHRMREMQGEIDQLRKEIALLKGPNEGSCDNEAQVPLAY